MLYNLCEKGKNMINKVKSQDGYSGVDIVISIGIIIIFVSIMSAIYLNLNRINSQITRMQTATNYAISIIERVDKLYYSEVTYEAFTEEALAEAGINISSGYIPEITIEKYSDEENTNRQDVVKTVTVKVKYRIGKDKQKQDMYETVEMKKIKTKEMLQVPNSPELASELVPIKMNSNEEYIVTNENDEYWYNYKNKKWALAVNSSVDLDEEGNVKPDATIYAWIPRYAYNQTKNEIEFVYSNGQKYVDTNGDLKKITGTIPSVFTREDKELTGVWIAIDTIDESMLSNVNTGKIVN